MIYTYDGSFDGLLTCIHEHYYDIKVTEIFAFDVYQPQLFSDVRHIETNILKAQKVYDAIMNQLGELTYWDIYHTFLSNNINKDIYILRYLITAFKMGNKINLLHAHHDTLPVRKISRQVGYETHRFLGLLRFAEVEGVLYSAFEPDHDILVLLGDHFADRLSNERFVIHDIKRKRGIFSNFGKWVISDFQLKEPIEFSRNEMMYQNLWKGYFEAIAIEERKNLKLQQSFVPLKYRKHILEFH